MRLPTTCRLSLKSPCFPVCQSISSIAQGSQSESTKAKRTSYLLHHLSVAKVSYQLHSRWRKMTVLSIGLPTFSNIVSWWGQPWNCLLLYISLCAGRLRIRFIGHHCIGRGGSWIRKSRSWHCRKSAPTTSKWRWPRSIDSGAASPAFINISHIIRCCRAGRSSLS